MEEIAQTVDHTTPPPSKEPAADAFQSATQTKKIQLVDGKPSKITNIANDLTKA